MEVLILSVVLSIVAVTNIVLHKISWKQIKDNQKQVRLLNEEVVRLKYPPDDDLAESLL